MKKLKLPILAVLLSLKPLIAQEIDRSSTNLADVQPFYFWLLGKGTYLRGAPIWVFDHEADTYAIPLAPGIGKVVKVGNTVFNHFPEP